MPDHGPRGQARKGGGTIPQRARLRDGEATAVGRATPLSAGQGMAEPLAEGSGPTAPVVDPRLLRRLLGSLGLRARKALSQHFLADPEVLEAIVAAARPTPGRAVLEIGPGLGVLTAPLLAAGAAVTAVEIDPRLVRRLRGTFGRALHRGTIAPGSPGSLRLVEGDALTVGLRDLCPPPYDVVANLPYHITSPVLHVLLEAPPRPERLVLMVQREVAERLAAPPGEMSYLSVFAQYHAAVRVVRLVPPEAFEPPPEVWSAVVVLEVAGGVRASLPQPLSPEDEEALWRLVQAAFRERRKMLQNVLPRQLPLPRAAIAAALRAAEVDGRRRPQDLAVVDWLRLVGALGPLPPTHGAESDRGSAPLP